MTPSASWKVKSCTVQLQISHTLWTMKFHCRTHNLSLVPILSQSTHILCKVHCNIIFTHIARFSKWSLPFSFSAKLCMRFSCLPYTPHGLPLYLHWYDHIIWEGVYKFWCSSLHIRHQPPATFPLWSQYSPYQTPSLCIHTITLWL